MYMFVVECDMEEFGKCASNYLNSVQQNNCR